MISDSQLTPRRAIYNILGCICKSPRKILEDSIILTDKDFGERFYKITFAAINNIIISNINVDSISAIDIDNYLSQDVHLYKIFEENGGLNFISSAIENCNEGLFYDNYKMIKKFTLLRDFNSHGFDIKEIYDPETLDLKAQSDKVKRFQNMSTQDIIDYFNLKLINIKNDWQLSGNKKTYKVSDGLDDLLDKLRETPDYGYPFLNKYYTSIFMGMRYGKLMIKSAGTGVGKTRTALTDIVSVSCPRIYDFGSNAYVSNGTTYASTFISTELDIVELQTCLIAIISGINERIIKEGNYSEESDKRIKEAVNILKESPITLHYISDFNISDIEQIIEKDILENNSKFVWFDYLQITSKLVRTTQQEFGMGLREDQILWNFTSRLKSIAEIYNVYISTSTQLNRNSNDREVRDASAIRGGKLIA